ncbi:hypothetical protein N7495_003925 [Penicillium taxi]|uniref:uncharacterized protein n=1 Tax=Penicillium taxi TaxID=168475 RepID=UPI002544F38E|nr:uncharacterized protein N7495_003925 [Penicillium taxi]KAJ5899181.1 hypothetical protein N7495_003925 [Penicillium taxi]
MEGESGHYCTEMKDTDSIIQDPGQSKKPAPEQASQLQRHEIKPASLKDGILEDTELLADLRSLSLNEDSDATADGWGTWRRSKFFILQYGPRHNAMFKAKYTNGYNTEGMLSISDPDSRITQLKSKDDQGTKQWRYSRENVVGICGVAFEERKYLNKQYKTRPAVWIKIKWKKIKSDDKMFLKGGCSWIPKGDFIRLCGKKDDAENKLREAWSKQTQRFTDWQSKRTDKSRERTDFSPTPCPMDAVPTLSTQRRGYVPTKLSGELKQESEDESENFVSTIPATDTSTIAKSQSPRAGIQTEKDESIISLSRKDYMAAIARKENWDDMSAAERKLRQDIAEADHASHQKKIQAAEDYRNALQDAEPE